MQGSMEDEDLDDELENLFNHATQSPTRSDEVDEDHECKQPPAKRHKVERNPSHHPEIPISRTHPSSTPSEDAFDLISLLPLELTVEILLKLTPSELLMCRHVSRTWEGLLSFDQLWEKVMATEIPYEFTLARGTRGFETSRWLSPTQQMIQGVKVDLNPGRELAPSSSFASLSFPIFLPLPSSSFSYPPSHSFLVPSSAFLTPTPFNIPSVNPKSYKDIYFDTKRFYLPQPAEGCMYRLARTPCPICDCSLGLKTTKDGSIRAHCPSPKSKKSGCGLEVAFVECYECGIVEKFDDPEFYRPLCSSCRGTCIVCGHIESRSCLFSCVLCVERQKKANEMRKAENEKEKEAEINRPERKISIESVDQLKRKQKKKEDEEPRWCADCLRMCNTDWTRVCKLCSFECHLCGNAYCANCAAPTEETLQTCINCSKALLPSIRKKKRKKMTKMLMANIAWD